MSGVYFGKVCSFHPELKGERRPNNRKCSECNRIYKRDWAKRRRVRNPITTMIYSRLRKENLGKACPTWANKIKIAAIYDSRGPGQVVDHIIPLKGICPRTKQHIVCGLHVDYNLSVTDAVENGQKWAWFDVYAYSHSIPAVV